MAAISDLDWMVLLDSLARGHCVVLVGPELSPTGGDPTPPDGLTALSGRLAGMLDQEHVAVGDPSDLPLLAQVFVDSHTRAELEVVVTSFYEEQQAILDAAPSPLFEDLARLPFPLYICSRQDRALAHYLTAAGKYPTEKTYSFRGDHQPTVGNHRRNDQPLVYHLFGSVGDPASMALTQRDLLDLLRAIMSGDPALPADLRNQFKEKNFLLLGCGLDSYYLRILLHALGLSRSEQRSFALEAATAQSVWFYKVEYRTLKFLDVDAPLFVRDLRERWERRPSEARGAGSPPPASTALTDRPGVFLSYIHEDAALAERLSRSLEEKGIGFWVDTANLRGGVDWEHALEDAIGKEVDFFLLLLSEHLADGVDTYVHWEIACALRRRSMRGAVKFIYPVAIDDGAELLDAIERARIQVTRVRDFQTDTDELARDIRREYAKLRRR